MTQKSSKSLYRFALVLATCLLAACSTPSVQAPTQYDLGSLPASSATVVLPPLIVAEVNAPAWLDGPGMIYRLIYANDQQVRTYALSRWTMPPAKLFEQRLKARLAQHGKAVLSATDGISNLPVLIVDLDEFSQAFSTVTQSTARVTVRVAILNGRSLVAQKTFTRDFAAPTPDAPGGAAAIVQASDAIISDIVVWLATQLAS